MLRFILTLLLSLSLTVPAFTPAFAQGSPSGLPAATVPLDGNDEIWVDQGAGCATNALPCTSKKATSLRVGNPIQANCAAVISPYTYQHCIDTSVGTVVEKVWFNSIWNTLATYSNSIGAVANGLTSPFSVGGSSVTTTATQFNYLNAATGTTGTTNTNLVYSTGPTLINPTITGGTITGATISNVPAQNPNILINSDMLFDQPFEGQTQTYGATSGGHYMADQWYAALDGGSPAYKTTALVADAPAGFKNSVKLQVTTGTATLAGSYIGIEQPIEYYNLATAAFGTSNAQGLCVSFWAKSSIAPYTFAFSMRNQASGVGTGSSRSYVKNFTISSAATWTNFSQCFSGDTSGTWVTVNEAQQATIGFYPVAGSTFQGTDSAWQAGDIRGTSSATNTLYSTTGATFQIAGPKLEIGSAATTFVHNSFETEYNLVRRYYEKTPGIGHFVTNGPNGSISYYFQNTSTTAFGAVVQYKTPKRCQGSCGAPNAYSTQSGNPGQCWYTATSADIVCNSNNYGQFGFTVTGTAVTPTLGSLAQFHYIADSRM